MKDRLQAFMEFVVSQHQRSVDRGADWAEERYWLGAIWAMRQAVNFNNNTDSTIPSTLIYDPNMRFELPWEEK